MLQKLVSLTESFACVKCIIASGTLNASVVCVRVYGDGKEWPSLIPYTGVAGLMPGDAPYFCTAAANGAYVSHTEKYYWLNCGYYFTVWSRGLTAICGPAVGQTPLVTSVTCSLSVK